MQSVTIRAIVKATQPPHLHVLLDAINNAASDLIDDAY